MCKIICVYFSTVRGECDHALTSHRRLDGISTADSQSQHGGTASVDLTAPSTSKSTKRSLKQSDDPETSSKIPLYSVPEDDTESTHGGKKRKVVGDGGKLAVPSH